MTTHSPATGRVAILGQGYVGLPVSARAVSVGFDVVGFDLDAGRVAALARGESFIDDVDDASSPPCSRPGGSTRPPTRPTSPDSTSPSSSVPTPLRDGAPDLGYIEDAAELLAPLRPAGSYGDPRVDHLPRHDREAVHPAASSAAPGCAPAPTSPRLQPGAHRPGNATWNFRNTPKVVSGVDDASLEAVRRVLRPRWSTPPSASRGAREAELTKLLENTFRHVNIALVNELAMFTHELGIDVWEAIDAATTKPFGFMRFTPGPGSAATACRSTRPTSRGRSAERSGGRSASSSWPTTSTSTCPTTSSPASRASSTRAQGGERGQRARCSGSPTRRTPATPASPRRWPWRSASSPPVPRSRRSTR